MLYSKSNQKVQKADAFQNEKKKTDRVPGKIRSLKVKHTTTKWSSLLSGRI